MAVTDDIVPTREYAEFALMYAILGLALWTIMAAVVVTTAIYTGVV